MTTDRTLNFGSIGRAAPAWSAKRPLRIAVLGDFGGGALTGRLETGDALGRRKPMKVEFDNLDETMARLDLEMVLPLGAQGSAVRIPVTELESFHPDELYRNLEVFAALSSLRKRLNNPATFAGAASEMKDWGLDEDVAASHVAIRSRARGAAPAGNATLDDFARLTGHPGSRAHGGEMPVDALLRRLVSPFVVPAAAPHKDALVAAVDEALTDAMRAVLHQPDFQNVESLWRGVDFLLRRLETSHQLQVHLIDISAEELAADLSSADDLADSGLYRQLVAAPSEDADGGYAYIAACYRFEATPPHAELLGRAARVAAHAGAPFLTAISPDAFTDRREPPHRLVREAFDALRDLPDASFLALFAPRFLLRHPYGKKSDPISSFAFEEFDPVAGLRGMLWGHPALLAASVLGTRGGQPTIDDLPFHYLTDRHGDTVALPCTERMINTDASALLRDFGINAVMAHKGEALVRLSGLQAINDDGLASGTAAPRKPASDGRVGIGTAAKERAPAGWTPAARTAGTVAAVSPPHTIGSKSAEAEAEAAGDDAEDLAPVPSDASGSDSTDAELAALLASIDSPDSGSEDAPADADSTDAELDALLASFSDPTPDDSSSGSASGADDEMDPDLKALLDSL